MGPREYFARHPRLFWLALSGPILTAAYSLVAMRRTDDPRSTRRYAALAAVMTVQVLGLSRIRPGSVRTGRTPPAGSVRGFAFAAVTGVPGSAQPSG
jgi:hypothetical protein